MGARTNFWIQKKSMAKCRKIKTKVSSKETIMMGRGIQPARPSIIFSILNLSFLLVLPQLYLSFRVNHSFQDAVFLGEIPQVRNTIRNKGNASPLNFTQIPSLAMNESFGACLMVKEDNDLLYEWLAYHYTKLPLRYVYVGSDEGNLHDPNDVLKRWKVANTGLKYWTVDAKDFIYRHNASYGHVNSTLETHHAFVTRQRGFITTCTEFMKSIGMHWVIYTDLDEFVMTNHFEENNTTYDDLDDPSINKTNYLLRRELPKRDSKTTVLDSMSKISRIQQFQSCYTMPRLLYGALENISCPAASRYFQSNNFLYKRMSTMRFHHHAKKGDFSMNKYGKVFMDVSKLSDNTISRQPKNIHRPYKAECRHSYVAFPESLFYVNHYLGSWERYNSRQDGRRNKEEWEKRAFITSSSSCHLGLYRWFDHFVELVGMERAMFLLGENTNHIMSEN